MSSLRILCQLDFPTGTARLWDGSGPYMDADGEIWRGCAAIVGLDAIEAAINGEASTLVLSVSGVDPQMSDLVWEDQLAGNVIGSRVRLLTQECDDLDQPVGDPVVEFTGRIDNIKFDDAVAGDGISSGIAIDCVNRFTARRVTHGAVLSDVDQKARAAVLNPTAPADRFCERVPVLQDQTIRWPLFD